MKFYIPFGDYSNDGHGRCYNVLVSAPSMEGLWAAQEVYRQKYGEYFWRGMADEYDNPTITEEIQQALLDTNYPLERFSVCQDDIEYDNFKTLQEVFESDFWNNEVERTITLDTCIDIFIWLLNAAGAQIEKEEDYPSIGWASVKFECVGYGCFYG